VESFIVKDYADNIFKGENFANVSKITEDLVHLFLKIRGYAVTRVERNKITTNSSCNNVAPVTNLCLGRAARMAE
jgi:hypothetical protein